MNTRLQELTEKVYLEGIEKAQSESNDLVNQAKQEAAKIIEDAKSSSQQILDQANSEAKTLKNNITSELQLAGRQMISKLKQDIQEVLVSEVIDQPLQQALSDQSVMEKLLLTSVKSLQIKEGEGVRIMIREEDEKLIGDQFQDEIHNKLKIGLSIKTDRNLKQGFKIGPENGNYLISFSDDDFRQLFSKYLRKETLNFLREANNE